MKRLTWWLLALTPACARPDAVPISDEEYDDTAMALGSTTALHGGGGETGAMADVLLLANGHMPLGFVASSDGVFHGQHLGVGYAYELACADAAGHPLALCDPTADTVQAHVTWNGGLALPRLAIAVARTGDWMIRDLATTAPQIDGDGHMTYDTRLDNPERGSSTIYHFAYDARYDQVRYAEGPLAGTAHYTVIADRTRDTEHRTDTRSFELDAVITFGSRGHARIELDGVRRYDLDITSGAVVRHSPESGVVASTPG